MCKLLLDIEEILTVTSYYAIRSILMHVDQPLYAFAILNDEPNDDHDHISIQLLEYGFK